MSRDRAFAFEHAARLRPRPHPRVVSAAALLLLAIAGCRNSVGESPAGTALPAPRDHGSTAGGTQVERLVVGFGKANCYLIRAAGSKEAIVVDPGGEAERIARTLRARGLEAKWIVHTHGHGDHVGGSRDLQARTGAVIRRHPSQGEVRMPSLAPGGGAGPVEDLNQGDVLRVGSLAFQVVHTPGHSPGSVCLFGHGVLVSGDLLFRGSVGRADLGGGSEEELRRSLHERLAHVPDDTRVLPGHGAETTMGQERRTNPWMRR